MIEVERIAVPMREQQKIDKKKTSRQRTRQPGQAVRDESEALDWTSTRDGPLDSGRVIQMQQTVGNIETGRVLREVEAGAEVQRADDAGTNFGYTVGGVTPLQQPSGMACWATVTTMMASYRDGLAYAVADIPDVVAAAGDHYRDVYNADTGLSNADKGPFLAAMGLRAEPPATYIATAVYDMMSSYGPLWVTTDGGTLDSVHARVVIGMGGDGSPAGTTMQIIDPGDGAIHDETYDVFVRRYTNVAVGDIAAGLPFRAQIVHW
jgi:hypothetical protein